MTMMDDTEKKAVLELQGLLYDRAVELMGNAQSSGSCTEGSCNHHSANPPCPI